MIIILIKIVLLAFLITQFEPIRWLLNLLPSNLITAILTLLLTCLKCCSFWIGLIMTLDIYMAASAFVIGFILDKVLEKYNRVKF